MAIWFGECWRVEFLSGIDEGGWFVDASNGLMAYGHRY